MLLYPWRFEQNQLQVEPETRTEEYIVAKEGDVELKGEKRLVDHGHHIVVKPEYPVIHIQGGELLFMDAHHVLCLGGHQPLLDLPPGH